jgi:hypothetical protein
MVLTSGDGQCCWPVVLLLLASGAAQSCCLLLLSSLLAVLASLLGGVHTHMHAHARMYCHIIITIAIIIIRIMISIILIAIIVIIIIIINIFSIFCTWQYNASKRALPVFEHISNRSGCRQLCNHTCSVIKHVNHSQEPRTPTRVAAVRVDKKSFLCYSLHVVHL